MTLQEVHKVYLETGREYYRTSPGFGDTPGHMVADDTIHEAAVFNYAVDESDPRRRNNMPLTPKDILADDWVNEPSGQFIPMQYSHQIRNRGSYMVIDAKKSSHGIKCFPVGFMQHDGKTPLPKDLMYIGPIDMTGFQKD
jgi:hypothetical protein